MYLNVLYIGQLNTDQDTGKDRLILFTNRKLKTSMIALVNTTAL